MLVLSYLEHTVDLWTCWKPFQRFNSRFLFFFSFLFCEADIDIFHSRSKVGQGDCHVGNISENLHLANCSDVCLKLTWAPILIERYPSLTNTVTMCNNINQNQCWMNEKYELLLYWLSIAEIRNVQAGKVYFGSQFHLNAILGRSSHCWGSVLKQYVIVEMCNGRGCSPRGLQKAKRE